MRRLLTGLALAFFLCLTGSAFADEPAGDKYQAPPKDAEGFEKVSGEMMDKGESIPANRLVGAAYGIIFAAVTVWVASVVARTRKVEEEMEALTRKLQGK